MDKKRRHFLLLCAWGYGVLGVADVVLWLRGRLPDTLAAIMLFAFVVSGLAIMHLWLER